jgi:hypothetical protein
MAQEVGHAMSARNVVTAAVLAASLAGMGNAVAQDAPRPAATIGLDYTSDTDGFHAFRARLGGLYTYANPWNYAGVSVQSTRYSQRGFDQDVPAIIGIYRDQRRDNLAGIDIEAGVARVAGHLRPVGEASWRFAATPTTLVDLAASGDVVETPLALDRGTAYTFLTAGIEQQLGERFTVAGLAGHQHFTDGNDRTHLRARLIWLAVAEHGVTLQARYRIFESHQADVGGAYFNPGRYQQWLAVAAVRKRHAGWVVGGALGAGQERSDSFDARASYLAELRAEIDLPRQARMVLRAGYYRGAGFIDTPDYAYRSASATLVVPF